MSDLSTEHVPVRTSAHSRAGIGALLTFQAIVFVFGVLLVCANVWPGLFSDTPAKSEALALRLGIYSSLPLGMIGSILGIVGIMQETRRRKFAVVGLLLCGLHTLICLFILRG